MFPRSRVFKFCSGLGKIWNHRVNPDYVNHTYGKPAVAATAVAGAVYGYNEVASNSQLPTRCKLPLAVVTAAYSGFIGASAVGATAAGCALLFNNFSTKSLIAAGVVVGASNNTMDRFNLRRAFVVPSTSVNKGSVMSSGPIASMDGAEGHSR